MRIYKAKDYYDMSRKAANLISAQVLLKPHCVLGLATGSSPIGTYRQLIEWYAKGDLDFSETRTVNLDEYAGLPVSNKESYAYFMQENFFKHVNFRADNNHIPNGMNADYESECAHYEQLIHNLGGVDMQLLGIGHNGHIGFNEPDSAFEKTTHRVALTESTIEANKRFFDSIDEVPRHAYTMGINTIMHARRILLIASGADKAKIIQQAFNGPITPSVPASILQLHRHVTLVGDREALEIIKPNTP